MSTDRYHEQCITPERGGVAEERAEHFDCRLNNLRRGSDNVTLHLHEPEWTNISRARKPEPRILFQRQTSPKKRCCYHQHEFADTCTTTMRRKASTRDANTYVETASYWAAVLESRGRMGACGGRWSTSMMKGLWQTMNQAPNCELIMKSSA